MLKIILTHPQEDAEIEKLFIPENSTLEIRHSYTEEELIENLQDADAVISAYEPITENVLSKLPKLKIISQAATGFNNVDIEAAAKRGIPVINNHGYCTTEVVEHTMALILALTRKLKVYSHSVQVNKEWKDDLCKDVKRLSSQTLGLFGYGKIGREVAIRAKAFGVNVIVLDPYLDESIAKETGVELVSEKEFLKRSDIISIHAPLTEDAKGFFVLDKYKKMERCPIIINTGRGEIINQNDLVEALDKEYINGAGLDVLEKEPPNFDDFKLLNRENVIITPHIAYFSEESQYEIQKMSAKNITLYLAGELDKLSIVNSIK